MLLLFIYAAIGKLLLFKKVQTTKILIISLVQNGAETSSQVRFQMKAQLLKLLIGKKVGDKVAIESPAGSYSVEILSVEKQLK